MFRFEPLNRGSWSRRRNIWGVYEATENAIRPLLAEPGIFSKAYWYSGGINHAQNQSL